MVASCASRLPMTQGAFTRICEFLQKLPTTIVLASWESAINPPEIFRLDFIIKNSNTAHRRSTPKKQVAKIDWQPLRDFWFTSKAGKKIHNLVALPPGFDEHKKYPLLVVMHGGPASMWRDNWGPAMELFHAFAHRNTFVLMTNYSGSTGFGEAFAQRIQGDPFKGPATR